MLDILWRKMREPEKNVLRYKNEILARGSSLKTTGRDNEVTNKEL